MTDTLTQTTGENDADEQAVRDLVTRDKQPIVRDLKNLTAEDKQEIERIKSAIVYKETDSVLQFGVEAQKDVSAFSDRILQNVRSRDLDDVGKLLNDMSLQIRGLNVNNLADHSSSFMERIPLIGNLFDEAARFVTSFEKVETKMENITLALKQQRAQLIKDIIMLDQFYDENLKYYNRLNLYILAGQEKLDELKALLVEKQQELATKSDDPLLLQEVDNLRGTIDRLDKRIYDLMLTKTIALQTMPQIKLIQSNDSVLAEKIQSSLLATIPIWKNQIVIAVSLFRQKKAVELQKDVADTTNKMLSKNSELLKRGSIATATEAERGVVELDTLRKVNQDLIDTINETMQIQAEGAKKRVDAAAQLGEIEQNLKNALVAAKSSPDGAVQDNRVKEL